MYMYVFIWLFLICLLCVMIVFIWILIDCVLYTQLYFHTIITVTSHEHLGVSNHWQQDCLIPWPLDFQWHFQQWYFFSKYDLHFKEFNMTVNYFMMSICTKYDAMGHFWHLKKLFSWQQLFCGNAWSRVWHYANLYENVTLTLYMLNL